MTYSFSYLEPVCCSMSFFNCCFLTCIQISQEAGQMVWLKNWCFWTVVLEKTHEIPLDWNKFQPVHSKGDQFWVFTGRTDVEAETLILWPSNEKSDSFEKTLMPGKIGGRRKRGWQRMRWLDCITNSMDVNEPQELVMDREAWSAVIHGGHKKWDTTDNWIELNGIYLIMWHAGRSNLRLL